MEWSIHERCRFGGDEHGGCGEEYDDAVGDEAPCSAQRWSPGVAERAGDGSYAHRQASLHLETLWEKILHQMAHRYKMFLLTFWYQLFCYLKINLNIHYPLNIYLAYFLDNYFNQNSNNVSQISSYCKV